MDTEQWLKEYTFQCPDLNARLTPDSCENNRFLSGVAKDWPCKKCTEFEGRRSIVMALAENVILATLKAIEESSTLNEVAIRLKITVQGVYYRLHNCDILADAAEKKGMYSRDPNKKVERKTMPEKKEPKKPEEPEYHETITIKNRPVELTLKLSCTILEAESIIKLLRGDANE